MTSVDVVLSIVKSTASIGAGAGGVNARLLVVLGSFVAKSAGPG